MGGDLKHPDPTVVLQDEALRSLNGFTQIPNVILKHSSLSYGAKLAFGVLLSYAWRADFCYPAQERLASDLHCSVRQVRRFLEELKAGNFIRSKQQGLNRTNVYYIRPKADWAPCKPRIRQERTDLSGLDRTPVTLLDRTNSADKEDSEKNIKDVNVNALSEHQKHKARQEERLVSEMIEVLGDHHSTGSYRLIARTLPEDLIFEVLSETKYQANMGRVRKTPGALFTDLIKRRAQAHGLKLPWASSGARLRSHPDR